MTLTEKQFEGLKKARTWWLSNTKEPFIIQGVAGSGKSTLAKFLVEEIGLKKEEVIFCTFTGKAASVLQRKGNHATTIHRLIYHPVETKTGEIKFEKEEYIEPNIKLIIIDEYAMVDNILMTDLFSFHPRVIMLGDPYQLPPIGEANKYINKYDVLLDEPMRQSLDSPIIYLADLARRGQRIRNGNYGNCKVISRANMDLNEFANADQIIACKNNTVKKLNSFYRRNFKGYLPTDMYPHIGEKLMCLKNNWGLECSEGEISTNLINGLTLMVETEIENINPNNQVGKISVRPEFFLDHGFKDIMVDGLFFQNNWNQYSEYWNNRNNFPDVTRIRNMMPNKNSINAFTYGYVCTLHKYQGSEANNIFYIHEYMGKDMYNKQLYTGITRASEKITIVI